jgi:hypothetical protein
MLERFSLVPLEHSLASISLLTRVQALRYLERAKAANRANIAMYKAVITTLVRGRLFKQALQVAFSPRVFLLLTRQRGSGRCAQQRFSGSQNIPAHHRQCARG